MTRGTFAAIRRLLEAGQAGAGRVIRRGTSQTKIAIARGTRPTPAQVPERGAFATIRRLLEAGRSE